MGALNKLDRTGPDSMSLKKGPERAAGIIQQEQKTMSPITPPMGALHRRNRINYIKQ
jgi:hypothetical protein